MLPYNYQEIEKIAKECQGVWGMGFPVISLELLKPFLSGLQKTILEQQGRIRELEETIREIKR